MVGIANARIFDLNNKTMPYFVNIYTPIGGTKPIVYTRDNYGDVLDLFKQKCSDYAIHASMVGDGHIYRIGLLDGYGKMIQEVNIHATKRVTNETH